MAKSRQNTLLWNVVFLLFIIAVGAISYQLMKKPEAFSTGNVVEKVVNGNGVLVVTMDKCPHCENMKEDLQSLSEEPSAKGYFAWADSKDESVAGLELSSFPSILVFKNGVSTEYTDERTKDKLLSLVKSTKIA